MSRPLKYSGVRAIQYETAKELGYSRNELKDIVNELNKRELKARKDKAKREAERLKKQKEEEERLLQEQLRLINERIRISEEKKKARLAKLAEKRKAEKAKKKAKQVIAVVDINTNKITDNDIFYIEVVEPIIKGLEKVLDQTHLYIQASQNGSIVVSELVKITAKTAVSIFWSDIWRYISTYNNGIVYNIFDTHFDGRKDENGFPKSLKNSDTIRFVIIKADNIPAEAIKQQFRDNEDNYCVLAPLYNVWKKMEDNSENDSSRKRCGQIARRIKGLYEKYPNGVPEADMDEIAKISHRCIIIHDIIGNEIMRFNKKSPKYFHFTNTRANHVDAGYITLDKQYERVSQDELDTIIEEHNKTKEFYLFNGDVKMEKAQSIRSSKGAWAVYNEDHDIFTEFSKSLGINNYGIDAVKYSSLNAFIKEARLINSAPTPLCDTPNDIDDVNHIDIEKAYTQHKYNKYYKGFLGHIHQYRKIAYGTNPINFLENHLGIFQFKVITNNNKLLQKLGLKVGYTYTLPSQEILYYIIECGMEIKLIAGAWGSKFDIEYTEEMLSNRRYCVWAGKLGMDNECDVFTFKGDREWASHLKTILGDDNVLYFSEQKLIVIKVMKRSYNTTHHILAFITSYTRLNMLDIMRKIDGELIKVILDGIYFRGEVPDVEIPHKMNKEKIRHIGFRDAWFFPSEIDTSNWSVYNKDVDGSCILAGAGGTGKSYSILTDKNIINPLYVVPSHLLGRKCRETYGCNYTTIHKLIGEECRPYKEDHKEPGVIFIDELTMIEGSWIEKAIKMYPNSLLFIAGDIDEEKRWFQTRNGHPGAFSKLWLPGNEWRYVYYTTDMRSKDQELKAFKTDIRRVMKETFTDGNQMDATRINYYVKKNYKTTPFEEAVKMFKEGDYWIAGTHKTNQKLLEKGIVSGYINKNKEIIQIADNINCEKRGSFTTHSFQGLTIDTARVFISLDFFEYAMLYTSISRVRNFNQLVLVN